MNTCYRVHILLEAFIIHSYFNYWPEKRTLANKDDKSSDLNAADTDMRRWESE